MSRHLGTLVIFLLGVISFRNVVAIVPDAAVHTTFITKRSAQIPNAKMKDTDSSLYSTLEQSFRESLETTIDKRQGVSVRDDLIRGECNDIIVIFARGTGGAGNIGYGFGPSFISAIEAAFPGKVIAQGVLPYAADLLGYLHGGSAEGGESMRLLTERAARQCEGAQIVLGGYSQGAQVTHLAAGLLSSTISARISAIVTFGDPKKTEPFPSTLNPKALVICNEGDLICEGQPVVRQEHSSEAYQQRLPEAISWIRARILPEFALTITSTGSRATFSSLTVSSVNITSTYLNSNFTPTSQTDMAPATTTIIQSHQAATTTSASPSSHHQSEYLLLLALAVSLGLTEIFAR